MGLYCGIDLHSNNHVLTVIDEADRRVYERRLPNDLASTTDTPIFVSAGRSLRRSAIRPSSSRRSCLRRGSKHRLCRPSPPRSCPSPPGHHSDHKRESGLGSRPVGGARRHDDHGQRQLGDRVRAQVD